MVNEEENKRELQEYKNKKRSEYKSISQVFLEKSG